MNTKFEKLDSKFGRWTKTQLMNFLVDTNLDLINRKKSPFVTYDSLTRFRFYLGRCFIAEIYFYDLLRADLIHLIKNVNKKIKFHYFNNVWLRYNRFEIVF